MNPQEYRTLTDALWLAWYRDPDVAYAKIPVALRDRVLKIGLKAILDDDYLGYLEATDDTAKHGSTK